MWSFEGTPGPGLGTTDIYQILCQYCMSKCLKNIIIYDKNVKMMDRWSRQIQYREIQHNLHRHQSWQTFQKLWAKISKFGRCSQVMVLMKPTKFCFDRSRRCPESISPNYKSKIIIYKSSYLLNKDEHQNSVLSLIIWANFGRTLATFVGSIANSFVF